MKSRDASASKNEFSKRVGQGLRAMIDRHFFRSGATLQHDKSNTHKKSRTADGKGGGSGSALTVSLTIKILFFLPLPLSSMDERDASEFKEIGGATPLPCRQLLATSSHLSTKPLTPLTSLPVP